MVAIHPLALFASANVTLAWNPSNDPIIAGYDIYYGGASGVYTNVMDAGKSTTVTISNLVNGTTYYFASTTYSAAGAMSAFSSELAYTVPSLPTNQPPTLNPIGNLTINANGGAQTVNLTGIAPGSASQNQCLTVSATSSNPNLVPNPTIEYTGTNASGALSLNPVANASGSVTITVMVNNGATDNNLTSRSFVVTVGTVTEQLRQAPGGQIVLTVTGPAGSNYVIQTSTDLINWIPFSTNTVPPGGSLEVVDMNPMVSQKFYRTAPYVARVPSPPQISGFSMNNSVYNFNLSGPAGSSFVIQSSTDLVNWTPFATNTIPGSGSVQIIDTNPGPNFKFYRALPYTTPANNAATVARLPQLTSLKMTNGVFSFTLNGAAGSNYVIQASTDLAHWTAFTTNTISPNGSVDIVDLQATAPQKFYRAVPYHSAIVSPSLQLSGLSMSNGVFSFVLTGTGGSNYIIQQSPNLVNWTPITTNTIPASGSVTILDSNPNSPQKFYRAEGF